MGTILQALHDTVEPASIQRAFSHEPSSTSFAAAGAAAVAQSSGGSACVALRRAAARGRKNIYQIQRKRIVASVIIHYALNVLHCTVQMCEGR